MPAVITLLNRHILNRAPCIICGFKPDLGDESHPWSLCPTHSRNLHAYMVLMPDNVPTHDVVDCEPWINDQEVWDSAPETVAFLDFFTGVE
jgi:hypothetical protein